MPTDPQAQAVLDELIELGARPIQSLTPAQARGGPTPADAVMSLIRKRGETPEPERVGSVEDRTVPGPSGTEVAVRIYRPDTALSGELPVVVYVHGGGWVLADLDVYDASPRAIADQADCIVVSVDYRRAPEHVFPAAHDDVLAAYRWVAANAAGIGGDPSRIATVGESAGGNLAAATALELAVSGEPGPVFQVLVYPVTNVYRDSPSIIEQAEAVPLNAAMLPWFYNKYLASPSQADDARLSPLRAPLHRLANQPPTLVITAELDPLRDEGEAFGHRLTEAGVASTVTRYDGVPHEFFGWVAVLDQAAAAVDEAAVALRHAFGTTGPSAAGDA